MSDSESDDELPQDLMNSPELGAFTKDSKRTPPIKTKSFARRVIEKIPDALLNTANLASAAGYVTNPYLATGLTAANLIKNYGHHIIGKKKSDYAITSLAGAAAAPAVYRKIKELRDPARGPALLQVLDQIPFSLG
jgi:hypothetical protein